MGRLHLLSQWSNVSLYPSSQSGVCWQQPAPPAPSNEALMSTFIDFLGVNIHFG